MKQGLIALLWLAVPVGAKAETRTWTYRLNAYPSEGQDCHRLAQDLGRQFATATGVPAVQAFCDAERGQRADLRFVYQAEKAVAVHSTAVARSTQDALGGYASETDCETALPTESQVFQRHVGQAPVFAYCYPESGETVAPWVLRLDAFGEAVEAPFLAGTWLFGGPIDMTLDGFVGRLTQRLTDANRDVRFMKVRGMGGYARLSVFYYSAAPMVLDARGYAQTTTAAQCREQLAGLEEALIDAGMTPLVTYCAEVLGRYEPQVVSRGTAVEPQVAVEGFASYAACVAQRPGLVQYYRESLQRPVTGGLCSLAKTDAPGHAWTVFLIERPASLGGLPAAR